MSRYMLLSGSGRFAASIVSTSLFPHSGRCKVADARATFGLFLTRLSLRARNCNYCSFAATA